MLIDWFTVGAQALNFAVLVWLMKRFLYKPVLDAIDAREKRIAGELAEADTKKADAQKAGDEFRHKSEAFDQQRAALLAEATADAQAQRGALLAAAHQAADDAAAARGEALASEAGDLARSLTERAQAAVFGVARQALADLANASLEARACEVFIARLRSLDDPARAGLATALAAPAGPALVRSAFELPPAQRAAIQAALADTFATAVTLRFETAPALVGGIELDAQGQKFAWSIADYLGALARDVDALLQPSPREAAAPTAAKDDGPSLPALKPSTADDPA